MRRERNALVLALLLVAQAAVAASTLSYVASSTKAGAVVPMTFAPGLVGTTTLGVNKTYATTSVGGLNVLLTDLVLLYVENKGLETHSTRICFVSANGINRIELAYVKVAGVTQVRIENGVLLQSCGSTTSILAGTSANAGGDIKISRGQKSTLTVAVESTPALRPGQKLTETWKLELAG